ncbi:endospore germination permease [Paenibacillus sp. 5J-6]|uniref:Endospore germination permease n=1 Tax=Paenibacillus silvestris TaxID=2606219 RepID=A0A6L8UWZ7_9BACL|nr:endospore germination permease [Paenibacillus silvestris]MZQ82615.1 endospore germination permease [Paenibacillus silvestris]
MLKLEKGSISIRQFTIIVIVLTLGDSILILPSGVAAISHQDAWLSAWIGLVFGLLVVWFFSYMAGLFPNLSLIQYTTLIAGKWLGFFINLTFLIYFFFTEMCVSWQIGDFMATDNMPETPIESIEIMFFVIMVFAVRLGIDSIIRAAEIFFPWVILMLLVLMILLATQMDMERMRPILENGMKPVIWGSLNAGSFPYMEIFCLLVIMPHVKEHKKVKRNFVVGALLGGIVINIILTQSILVLGEYRTANTYYSSFALAQQVSIRNIAERLEAIIAFTWIITTYIKTTLYFYALNIGIAQMLKLKDYKILTLPIGMISFASIFISIPSSQFFSNIAIHYWALYDIAMSLVVPLCLLGIYAVRKKKLRALVNQSSW